jgi:hypothetical protein
VTTTLYEYDDPRYLNTKITQTGAGLANKEVKFTYNTKGENTKIERYLDGLLKVTTDNAYDIYGRLTGIAQVKGITPTNPTGTPISDDVYVLDNLNRLQTQTKGGQVKEIGYDKTDQVQTVTGGAGEAYNAGVGFNLGYWGKVAENGFRGEELTNGAWQSGAFGGIGAGAGELLQAGAGAATSKIKDLRLDYALKPLRKEFGTNVNWGFEGNNITLKEAKSLVKNIGQNPVSNSLLREVNSSTGGYKLNVNFNTKTTKEIGKVIKLGDEAGDLFGMISYQSQNGLVKSTKPIDISIYWDAIKNKSAGFDPVHIATSKVSHELTHATDIFRTGRRVNHLSDEWVAYENEKLALNYYKGISEITNKDHGHIARQVGIYRGLSNYIDDLGEALDEML